MVSLRSGWECSTWRGERSGNLELEIMQFLTSLHPTVATQLHTTKHIVLLSWITGNWALRSREGILSIFCAFYESELGNYDIQPLVECSIITRVPLGFQSHSNPRVFFHRLRRLHCLFPLYKIIFRKKTANIYIYISHLNC